MESHKKLDTVYLVYCYSGMRKYDTYGISKDSYIKNELIVAFASKQDALDYCAQMPHIYTETEEENFYSEQWRSYYVKTIPVN